MMTHKSISYRNLCTPKLSKGLASHWLRGKLKLVDLDRIIFQDRTLYSSATFSQLIAACLNIIAFLAFQMEEIMETHITPNLSRTVLPTATRPLNIMRCSNPPSTKTAETPSHFNDSLQIHHKKIWFTISSLPQPPTQYNDEFNLSPLKLRLSLVGNLLWNCFQTNSDILNRINGFHTYLAHNTTCSSFGFHLGFGYGVLSLPLSPKQ